MRLLCNFTGAHRTSAIRKMNEVPSLNTISRGSLASGTTDQSQHQRDFCNKKRPPRANDLTAQEVKTTGDANGTSLISFLRFGFPSELLSLSLSFLSRMRRVTLLRMSQRQRTSLHSKCTVALLSAIPCRRGICQKPVCENGRHRGDSTIEPEPGLSKCMSIPVLVKTIPTTTLRRSTFLNFATFLARWSLNSSPMKDCLNTKFWGPSQVL